MSLLVIAAKSMLQLAVAESISQYKWLYFRENGPKPLTDLQMFDAASRGTWGALQRSFILGASQIPPSDIHVLC